MSATRVFISYSHDSPQHSERVLLLAFALRANGVDVELDQFHNEEILDWPRWCNEQTNREHVDFIICVCTKEYARRIEGKVPPEKGKGVYWEGSLIDDDLYDEKGNSRLVPILFDNEPDASIPRFLRGWTHCRLSKFELNHTGYEQLIRILTRQARVEKNRLGEVPSLSTRGAPTGAQSLPQTDFLADISRIVEYAPAELIGRESEVKLLNDAWDKVVRDEAGRPHVLTFVALGGEGKTSLVAKWAVDEMLAKGWRGSDAAFAWSFYSQSTREQLAASSDLFLKEALIFFGDEIDKEFAASNAGAYEKGQRLARIVGQRRNLLILDGLEPLQYAPTSPTPGELKDAGIAALLKGLAANNQGLCVVTTRYAIPDLKAFRQSTAPELNLLRLSREAGVHLLKSLGVSGTPKEFEALVEDVKGHALTLTLLGGFLRRAFHGDIRMRDRVKFEKADEKMDGGHAFRTMAAYERWLLRDGGPEGQREVAVLRMLGLFDRPADAGCLRALRSTYIPGLTKPLAGLAEDDWAYCLGGLEDAKLLTVNRDAAGALVSLDAHPLLREYFAKQVRTKNPIAWRGAHRRLYEYLLDSTQEGEKPTLEDLQPLYQAVVHGCQAGLQREAFDRVLFHRIQQGNEAYAVKKIGAFGSQLGAIACFFDTPWSHVSLALREADQAWFLAAAAFCLRALGRLTEALEPMRVGLKMRIKQEAWRGAAIIANNLSELELTLGQVSEAMRDAEQAVTYADRGGTSFERITERETHGDAMHQAGRRAEAATRFREAEHMQAEREPDHSLLYSTGGFKYCDLLLVAAELAAWRAMQKEGVIRQPLDLGELCREVAQRAAKTLNWAEHYDRSLLSPALDHLTLGRVALYQAILVGASLIACRSVLEQALEGIRSAGTQHWVPSALLTRAWLRFLSGVQAGPESAQEDLDEAWEIAERGSMKLFMADIHLYRARLFGQVTKAMRDDGGGMNDATTYPWGKNLDGSPRVPMDDLAAARKLIEQCGYWRRKEELEDAEEAAKNW